MAEVVGLAASIAGLLGITGQIGKSALFIKGFLEDTKNALEEVLRLAAEIELLATAAKKTDVLLSQCHADELFPDLEDERKALVRYADMIERLKGKIGKDVRTFGIGKGHWWDRMGSATRKKSVEGYLVGVERAKTLVLGMKSKIIIQLQRHHGDSLAKTNQSLDTLNLLSIKSATTFSKIETQTSRLTTWTGTTDQVLADLSTEVQHINTNFIDLRSAIQTIQPQSVSTELSGLDAMLESAVMRGLKHQQELQNNGPHCSTNMIPWPSTDADQPRTSDRCDKKYSHPGKCAMVRRDKTIFRTQFRTPFFDIVVETKEAQRLTKRNNNSSYHDLCQLTPAHSQRFTKYSVRVKIPFWRSGMTFQSGNPDIIYGGELCKTFRSYNCVPCDAPIIRACQTLNLSEVRRLFEAGLASPIDVDSGSGDSLVDTVTKSIFVYPNNNHELLDGITLLRYLVRCLAGDVGRVNNIGYLCEMYGEKGMFRTSNGTMDIITESCRIAINHSSENPLDDIGLSLNIKLAATPIYKVLATQDKWWLCDVNQDATSRDKSNTSWFETDLQMLNDPEGLDVKASLANGSKYVPYHSALWTGNGNHTIHTLLLLAAETMEGSFHRCVLSRLIILLNLGSNPREVIHMNDYWSYFGMDTLKRFMERPLSCTEFAIELKLEDLWRVALAGAGWSYVDIDELFEEDLSRAVESLLSGKIQYQSHDDQRAHFIDCLRNGGFVDLTDYDQESFAYDSQNHLGLHGYQIYSMIKDATSTWMARRIPGSWVDEKEVSLMPGRDFKISLNSDGFILTRYSKSLHNVEYWHCIQEIWEIELGGRVPDGYQKRDLGKDNSVGD
ncbi:hypothetical protein VTL71DRAFT_2926 [Oculimacula yallundae]|uniref:Fungal N-terminal domain-containing protein n=1 Tax=Oculimacula yallundae TaxID=86028 RepID=A0ABR4C5P1_9HELO